MLFFCKRFARGVQKNTHAFENIMAMRCYRQRMLFFCKRFAISPRNPRIPIYRFCLQTAFRARMRIFKSGISGSVCNRLQTKGAHWVHYSDALLFCERRWPLANLLQKKSIQPNATHRDNVLIELQAAAWNPEKEVLVILVPPYYLKVFCDLGLLRFS